MYANVDDCVYNQEREKYLNRQDTEREGHSYICELFSNRNLLLYSAFENKFREIAIFFAIFSKSLTVKSWKTTREIY